MEFAALDWGIITVVSFFTVVGLFKGFSGQLGSLVGMAAALVAGYFLYAPLKAVAGGFSWVSSLIACNAVAGVMDFVCMLVVFGIVRRIVSRFVSFLVPQPINAILGALIGFVKGAVPLGIFIVAGYLQTGLCSRGFFATHSVLVKTAGELADLHIPGAVE